MSLCNKIAKDSRYNEYATTHELHYAEMLQDGRSVMDIALHFSVDPATVRASMKRLLNRASLKGFAPDSGVTVDILPTHNIGKVTTLYGPDGEKKLEWVAQHRDDGLNPEKVLEIYQQMFAGSIQPIAPVPQPQYICDVDLLAVYPIGDAHVGMLAWHEETGEDFDLTICEDAMVRAMSSLVECAPKAATALLINAGDFFHADDPYNVTPASKHSLDVDGRFAKIIRSGLRIITTMIELALAKHDYVEVVNNKGNHDPVSSIWLNALIRERYADNPRVLVHDNLTPLFVKRFGNVLIATTHGHAPKANMIPGILMSDYRAELGSTSHTHVYLGHVHHKSVQEAGGIVFETMRTLAGKDHWHSAQGYRSQRAMKIDVYNRDASDGPTWTVSLNAADLNLNLPKVEV